MILGSTIHNERNTLRCQDVDRSGKTKVQIQCVVRLPLFLLNAFTIPALPSLRVGTRNGSRELASRSGCSCAQLPVAHILIFPLGSADPSSIQSLIWELNPQLRQNITRVLVAKKLHKKCINYDKRKFATTEHRCFKITLLKQNIARIENTVPVTLYSRVIM